MEALKPLVRFAVHSIVGLLVAVLAGVPAFAIHWLIKVIDGWGLPDFVVSSLGYLEKLIFVLDLGLLVVFYVREASKLLIETLSGERGSTDDDET